MFQVFMQNGSSVCKIRMVFACVVILILTAMYFDTLHFFGEIQLHIYLIQGMYTLQYNDRFSFPNETNQPGANITKGQET